MTVQLTREDYAAVINGIERGTMHNINPEMKEQLRLVKELGDNYPFMIASRQQSIVEWC